MPKACEWNRFLSADACVCCVSSGGPLSLPAHVLKLGVLAIAQVLEGLAPIRAFAVQQTLTAENHALIDKNLRAFFTVRISVLLLGLSLSSLAVGAPCCRCCCAAASV
jgi:hypothetical protein